MIEGLEIQNLSARRVTATRLLVPATGAFVSCGNLAPQARCATTFPEVAYTANPVEVTWSQDGRIHSTGPLQVTPNDAVRDAGRARVRVFIVGAGMAGVELVPISENP